MTQSWNTPLRNNYMTALRRIWNKQVKREKANEELQQEYPSKHSTQICSRPLSARQGSWRADNGPL